MPSSPRRRCIPRRARRIPHRDARQRFMTHNGRSLVAGWRTMVGLRNAIVMCVLMAGCSCGRTSPARRRRRFRATVPRNDRRDRYLDDEATASLRRRRPQLRAPLLYVFPFIGKKVSYGHRHHGYPATDVFGCGATLWLRSRGTIERDAHVRSVGAEGQRPGNAWREVRLDAWRRRRALLLRPSRFGRRQPGERRRWRRSRSASWARPATPATRSATRTSESRGRALTRSGRFAAARSGRGSTSMRGARANSSSPVDEVAAAKAANPDACNLAALAPSAGDA